ncbi:MAG: hypothetical protein WCN95_10010, partial [bacterium]
MRQDDDREKNNCDRKAVNELKEISRPSQSLSKSTDFDKGGRGAIAIKPRIPRQQFTNLSIVLVLSEAEPSGPRP